jgi:hypothetical protein
MVNDGLVNCEEMYFSVTYMVEYFYRGILMECTLIEDTSGREVDHVVIQATQEEFEGWWDTDLPDLVVNAFVDMSMENGKIITL